MTWIPQTDQHYERDALWRGDDWRHSTVTDQTVQRSIAISLKRIADMIASAIETRSAETEGLGPKDEGATAKPGRPKDVQ